MKKQITKNQHYVPQFYLKNFTDDNGFLHVYNRETRKFFKSTPKDICKEEFLYEVEWKDAHLNLMKDRFILANNVEKLLGEKESEFSALLNKIVSICDNETSGKALILYGDEKKVLRSFVANMYVRNPAIYRDYHNFYVNDEVMESEYLSPYKEILEQTKLGGFETVVSGAIQKTAVNEDFGFGHAFDVVKKLEPLHFTIFKANRAKFITASLSVLIEEKDDDYSYVMMPLTPQYLVMFTNDKNLYKKRNRVLKVEVDFVRACNKQFLKVYSHKLKFLISSNEEELKYMLKSNYID